MSNQKTRSARRAAGLWLAGLAALAPAAGARALTPQEVAVVANASSAESVTLARAYLKARGIPEGNLVLLKTTTGYEITAEAFEKEIRQPLREALTQDGLKERITCLALMWGVPGRVKDDVLVAHSAGAHEARRRMALAMLLLAQVGESFPQPRTDGLEPLEKLFAEPLPEAPRPPPSYEDLKSNLSRMLASKEVEAAKIDDPARRAIAARQLMALHRELGGIRGLIDHVAQAKPPGAPDVSELRKRLDEAERKLLQTRDAAQTVEAVKARTALLEESGGLHLSHAQAAEKAEAMKFLNAQASTDGELALLWWDQYDRMGPAHNMLHWNLPAALRDKKFPPVLMAARIDAPTPADAVRMIKDSLVAERQGLKGTFYIDAGGGLRIAPDAVRQYDLHLKRLYSFLAANTKLKVVLDDKPTLFAKGDCPDAAMYVGWYSLQQYVPAFAWVPGAVGWHIASWEAVDLRNPDSQQWCVQMLRSGVAATVGAVNEPFLHSFPLPEEFFPLLLTGKWTVAECYWRTNPMASWKQSLLADPLYNPFAADPQVAPAVLPSGLAP